MGGALTLSCPNNEKINKTIFWVCFLFAFTTFRHNIKKKKEFFFILASFDCCIHMDTLGNRGENLEKNFCL